MHPIKIPQTNHTFTRPESMTEEECFDMPVVAGRREDGWPEIISVWQLTPEEIEHISKTGKIYLGVVAAGIPPMWLSVVEPTFPVMPEPESKVVGFNSGDIIKN